MLVYVVTTAWADGRSESLENTTQWTRIESAFGTMNLDGTLWLRYSLGDVPALVPLGIRFVLEHRVETNAVGHARSQWRVKGLQSGLAPAGRAQLRWQPLVGAPVNFEQARIGWRLSEAGSPHWLIRELDQAEHEIRSLDGRAWRYRSGVLVAAEHPSLGLLRFSTQGTWITQIEQTDSPAGAPPLLRARYDSNGRLIEWQAGDGPMQQLKWSVEGYLTGWRRADGSEMQFHYEAGLLAQVVEPGKPFQRFTWQENAGYRRGDSRWVAPVHVASDGENEYTYKITSKGVVMTRTRRADGLVTVTVANPRRRQIRQRIDGIDYLVVFRSGSLGSALDRVEVGGEIVERYLYDEQDRLVEVRRNGKETQKISYDESGRLMALDTVP